MKHTLRHALSFSGLVLLALFSTGCTDADDSAQLIIPPSADGTQKPATKKITERYTLRPTDALRIEMYQELDSKLDVSVSQEGDIVLPLIGKVQVGGMTLNEAQQKLTERYRDFYKEPQVTILMLKYAERKVYVDGMVGRAGPVLFPAEENLTIMRAIAASGGILPRGERSDVKLKRVIDGNERIITIDTAKISSGKAPDIELQENDYIYVRDSRI